MSGCEKSAELLCKNYYAKSIDPGHGAQSVSVEQGRNFLHFVNVPHIKVSQF